MSQISASGGCYSTKRKVDIVACLQKFYNRCSKYPATSIFILPLQLRFPVYHTRFSYHFTPSVCITIPLLVIDHTRTSYHVLPRSTSPNHFVSLKILSISTSTTTPSETIPALVSNHTFSPHDSYPSAYPLPQTHRPKALEPQSPASSTPYSHSIPPTAQPTSPLPRRTTQSPFSVD